MPGPRPLYHEDFVRWSEEQAGAIRAAKASGTNLPLDWENLAEEIESLGRSLRSELRSRLAVIIEHLLKLQLSDAVEPDRGWIETIRRERLDVEELLDENPSLRAALAESVVEAHRKGRRLAELALDRHSELSREAQQVIQVRSYGVDEVTGPWLSDRPISRE